MEKRNFNDGVIHGSEVKVQKVIRQKSKTEPDSVLLQAEM